MTSEAITIATAYLSPTSVQPVYTTASRLVGRKTTLYGENTKKAVGLQSRRLFG
jgi:hypothetical protein